MIVTQTIQMILAFILAALTVTNTVQIWPIVVLALLLGITNAVDSPARIALTAVFGLTLITQFVGASTLIQLEVPREFRGRVLALYSLVFAGLTPFGSLALGLIAALIGIATAILVTAIVSRLVSLVILLRWAALWQRRVHEKATEKVEAHVGSEVKGWGFGAGCALPKPLPLHTIGQLHL